MDNDSLKQLEVDVMLGNIVEHDPTPDSATG